MVRIVHGCRESQNPNQNAGSAGYRGGMKTTIALLIIGFLLALVAVVNFANPEFRDPTHSAVAFMSWTAAAVSGPVFLSGFVRAVRRIPISITTRRNSSLTRYRMFAGPTRIIYDNGQHPFALSPSEESPGHVRDFSPSICPRYARHAVDHVAFGDRVSKTSCWAPTCDLPRRNGCAISSKWERI